jgi:hypothetical protein
MGVEPIFPGNFRGPIWRIPYTSRKMKNTSELILYKNLLKNQTKTNN